MKALPGPTSDSEAIGVQMPGPDEYPYATAPYRVYSSVMSEIPADEANRARLDVGMSLVLRGQTEARIMYLDTEPVDIIFGTAPELESQIEDRTLDTWRQASRRAKQLPEIDFDRADFDTLAAVRNYLDRD